MMSVFRGPVYLFPRKTFILVMLCDKAFHLALLFLCHTLKQERKFQYAFICRHNCGKPRIRISLPFYANKARTYSAVHTHAASH